MYEFDRQKLRGDGTKTHNNVLIRIEIASIKE